MSKYFETKKDSLEQAVLEAMSPAQQAAIAISKKEKGEKPKEEDKLDPVNPDAVKKKFKNRKDKDIDNDGDVDSSDKFLHKRRKAISKAVKEQNETLIQRAANEITKMWEKSAKVKSEEEMDDEDEEEPKNGKKTMTGKPMSKVETAPKDKIEK
jgi:hypothetical protein|tara:strand:- start:1080 stop:1541 length:462 start_codon:yes stop_codon:yes gene_type:complete